MNKVVEFNPFQNNPGESGIDRSEKLDKHLNISVLTKLLESLAKLGKIDPFNSINVNNIDIRRKNIEDASNEELYTWINNSSEDDWQLHPSFYHAVIMELKRKNLIPNSNK